MEMVRAFSSELGFVAGGLGALYFDASNAVICISARAGALIATGIRHLLKAKGIYRPRLDGQPVFTHAPSQSSGNPASAAMCPDK